MASELCVLQEGVSMEILFSLQTLRPRSIPSCKFEPGTSVQRGGRGRRWSVSKALVLKAGVLLRNAM